MTNYWKKNCHQASSWIVLSHAVTVITALMVVGSPVYADNAFSWEPSVSLTDDLDEPERLGFCIDISGFRNSINCNLLQAHSCKAQGTDTQFAYDSEMMALRAVNYDSNCDVIEGGGTNDNMACVTINEPMQAGSTLGLAECDESSNLQRFVLGGNNGEEGHELRVGVDTNFCLAVSSTTRQAGPFVARDLLLSVCDNIGGPLKTWTINPKPPSGVNGDNNDPPEEASLPTALEPQGANSSIVDIALDDGRFTTLVQLVAQAGLANALSRNGPFTVFAPVDSAFSGVPTRFLDEEYSAHLRSILLYHVIGAEVFSSDLRLDLEATTLNGENVIVTSLNPPRINDVDVIIPDIEATNGVIHVINELLLPTAATESIVDLAVATDELSTLVDLVVAAGLADVLAGEGTFTVFAPTNRAFSRLPIDVVESLTDPDNIDALIDVLLYHVVGDTIILSSELQSGIRASTLNGDSVQVTSLNPPTINESVVIAADILANNGVVHMIDSVLIPGMESESESEDEFSGESESEDESSGDDPRLVVRGNNGSWGRSRLDICEGDCDSDRDCRGNLRCFDSSSSRSVPGCVGRCPENRAGNMIDFCYHP